MSTCSLGTILKILDKFNRDSNYPRCNNNNDPTTDAESWPLKYRQCFYEDCMPQKNVSATTNCRVMHLNENELLTVVTNNDDFKMVITNVTEFKTVKINNSLHLIEGWMHDDSGCINKRKHFARYLRLPQGYKADNVVSTFCPDGTLTICIPKVQ